MFARSVTNPLECDAVILDEVSMVDITLMQALINALPHGARLVLVGDADQLPPVGPGNFLRDLITSHRVPIHSADRDFPSGAAVGYCHERARGQRG